MNQWVLGQLKAWLDEHPGHREVDIKLLSSGVYVELRMLSPTLDKLNHAFTWDELVHSHLDLLSGKLCEMTEKMSDYRKEDT